MGKGLVEGSVLEDVRQYASVHRVIRKKQLKEVFGFTENQLASAIKNLCIQGYLKRISHGEYQFNDAVEKPTGAVEEMIWRAMGVNQTFTASTIARHAGSTTAYVYKFFRQLREDGLIRQYGRKEALAGGYEKVWRLTYKGKVRADKPVELQFVPDPLVEQTVTLNNLICSGRAKRDEDARIQAIGLCQSISQQLSEDMEA